MPCGEIYAMRKVKSISEWEESERPREKFLEKGGESLSVTELLAIIMGSGTREQNAVELAREIWNAAGNSFHNLSRFRFEEYARFRGIGAGKAISIMAALEIARRSALEAAPAMTQVYSSETASRCIGPLLKDLAHEECWVLYLSRSNRLLGKERLSIGGTTATVLDIKIILRRAMLKLAEGIILVHNHPSGNDRPGQQDREQTRRLKEAAKSCDITLLDHIIIAGEKYYSFADNGIL